MKYIAQILALLLCGAAGRSVDPEALCADELDDATPPSEAGLSLLHPHGSTYIYTYVYIYTYRYVYTYIHIYMYIYVYGTYSGAQSL